MTANTRKNHKKVSNWISLSELNGPINEVFAYITKNSEGLIDPEIEVGWRDDEIYIVGWVPMTEKEIEKAAKVRERARKSAAKNKLDKEAAERREYERLQKKFEAK